LQEVGSQLSVEKTKMENY